MSLEQVNDSYPNEIPFETEYEQAREVTEDFTVGRKGTFRSIISRACRNTYGGERSVEGFVKFATALIKDEHGHFNTELLSVQTLFLNSLKSIDIDLEVSREMKDRNAELLSEYNQQNQLLIKMINGLVATDAINTGLCKMHFSSQLLADAGIIPNKILFERRLVRLNTALLYKQHKFNLLREDTEGYAGLMNDLTVLSIDNQRDDKGKLEPTPMDRIPEFLSIISSRIGAFYLDPNRVLDIILDFFINQLTVNYKFWVELIKQSGWIQKTVSEDLESKEPASPSAILAQLFGFRFYNYHEKCNPAPKELYLAIAILLKSNLILLGDIIPHLSPYQEEMIQQKNTYMANMNKEIKSNSGGKLATYGALGEEGATEKIKRTTTAPVTTSEEEKEQKKYEANDVVELVKALLSVGDLNNFRIMLAEYEKIIEMYPQLEYDIYRICDVVLQPAYENFVPEKTKELYKHFNKLSYESKLKSALSTQDDLNPKIPKEVNLKRVLVIDALLNDTQDLNKMERYVFFYKEWKDQLEYCETPEHLTTRFMPLMRLAGYKTYLATDLVQKLVLIVSGLIERENEFPDCRNHCTNMLREFLLPAISFSEGNPGTMASIWEILCRFTFQERYCLYGEWGNDFYKKTIEAKLLKARVERSVKYVMRRVEKNNIRRCGRDIGKLAHSNPMIIFNVILDQVQNFDNMAPLMADACRYLGDFSYDVLGYVLTEKWTGSQGPGREKKKKQNDDGMPATWLRALSVFTGMLFKKQDIDSTPLLRYLAYRLRDDDSVADLILLNEFVTKMGGIEILASACTDDQITAAGCSDFLKTEAFSPISADNRRASRRVLNRLKESLRRNKVGFEILVLLYRLEEACTSELGVPASDRCFKLDRIRQSQIQYFELLTSLFEGEEYNSLVPNVDALVKDYKLPLDVAMNFNRPKTKYKIATEIDTPIVDGEIWPVFKPLTETVSTILNDPPMPSMFTSEFYVIFWSLSLYDIYCPVAHYEAAMKRHTETIRQCQDPRSTFFVNGRPVSDARKAERHAQASLEALRQDLPKHKAHVEKMLSVLESSKSRWFPSSMHRVDLINNILQFCLLPRSTQSELDAAFCYEFSMLMHRMNTKNFSSLTLIDKILSEHLAVNFIAFSEYETTIHSRFIFKILSKMASWHTDEKYYLKQAQGEKLIGFQKNWSSNPSENVAKEDLLSFNDFQRVLAKWHLRLYHALEQALQSDESHLIKNAFLVLRQFIPHFPAITDNGEGIAAIVKKLSEEESRANIKVLARSYIGLIAKYKTKWVSKNQFMGLKDPAPPAPPVEIKITPNSKDSSSSSKSNDRDDSSRRRDDTRRDESRRDDSRRDDSRRDDSRRDESRRDDTRRDESRRDDTRRDESRRDDTRRDDTRRDESRRDDTRRDESRRDDTRRDESRRDESRRDEPRKDTESRREESDSKPSTSSSKPASPTRHEEADPSPLTNDRKRTRETESTRSLKSPRVEESDHRRTPAAPSSSRRSSPTKESPSRTETPHRELPRRDPARDAIRDAVRDSVRDSPRKEVSSRIGSSPTTNSLRVDDRSTVRSSRVSSTIDSTSSRHDDRHVGSASPTRGTKRNSDSERDRERDRTDKRRDIRSDRSREERPRLDDRMRDHRRMDDRRPADRRIDDRRDRPRDHRSRRH